VGRYQKGKTKLDFAKARDSEWQWHQLGHMMQVCTLFQTDNHTSTSVTTQFFTGRMPFLPPNQQRHSTEGNADSYTQMHVSLGRNREKKTAEPIEVPFAAWTRWIHAGKGKFWGHLTANCKLQEIYQACGENYQPYLVGRAAMWLFDVSSTATCLPSVHHGSSRREDAYCNTLVTVNECRVPELILVLGSQPADDMSHKPGGRLP